MRLVGSSRKHREASTWCQLQKGREQTALHYQRLGRPGTAKVVAGGGHWVWNESRPPASPTDTVSLIVPTRTALQAVTTTTP